MWRNSDESRYEDERSKKRTLEKPNALSGGIRKGLGLTLGAADDAGVVAAEAEAVVHGGIDFTFRWFERCVVQVANWILIIQVCCRRHDVVMNGKHCQHHLDAATRPECVP